LFSRPTQFLILWNALELWKKSYLAKIAIKDQLKPAFLAFEKMTYMILLHAM
jgi:hypothetical protein